MRRATSRDTAPRSWSSLTFALISIRRETPWRFGSRSDCLRCHNAWAGEALTLGKQQLGGRGVDGASELDRLNELGVLKLKGQPDRSLRPIVNPYDQSGAVADRARSWLHVNCSACHRFGAGGAVAIHLNFDKPLTEMRSLDEKPTRGDFGLLGGRVIASGDPYRSALLYRISTEGSGRMPHLGSRLVDEAGVRLVRDWILSLPQPQAGDRDLAAARQLAEQNAALLLRTQGEGRHDAIGKLLGNANGCLALLNEATGPAQRSEAAVAAASHTNALVRDLFQRFLPPEQYDVWKDLVLNFNPNMFGDSTPTQ